MGSCISTLVSSTNSFTGPLPRGLRARGAGSRAGAAGRAGGSTALAVGRATVGVAVWGGSRSSRGGPAGGSVFSACLPGLGAAWDS